MPEHRFYHPHLLEPILRGTEFHHLYNVMRLKIGETVELVDGKGAIARATIVKLSSAQAELKIDHVTQIPPPPHQLILAQALTKPSLLDWIIEKGTELGATHFWLFPGEKSEKKEISPTQWQRLQTITITALKQSGRPFLPILAFKPPIVQWEPLSIPLHFGSLQPTTQSLRNHCPSSVIIAIGPESGFSHSEYDTLENKLRGIGVKFHPNTLRTETAAICALSLYSDLNHK